MTPRALMTPDQVASRREAARLAWEEKHDIPLYERGSNLREVRAANVVGEFFKRLRPKEDDEE